MIGSIYSVIMWLTSLEVTKLPMSIFTFDVLFFIICYTLVPGLEKLKTVLKNKNIETENMEVEY